MEKLLVLLLILLLSIGMGMADDDQDDDFEVDKKKNSDRKDKDDRDDDDEDDLDCEGGAVQACLVDPDTNESKKMCVTRDIVARYLNQGYTFRDCSKNTCSGDKLLMCYVPPGNPSNKQEICVNEKTMKDHVRKHKGYLGKCVEEKVGCGGIVINSGIVEFNVIEKNAAFSSDLYLDEPEEKLLISDVKEGDKVLAGYFPRSELRFFIDVKKSWKHYSDSQYCKLEIRDDKYILYFEDMKGGGDWDYNDVVFSIEVEECGREICDGIDNDCDGEIDESLTRSCGDTDTGVCQFGVETCEDGVWGVCEGDILPDEEICDGVDNDCDGLTDESLVQACGSDVGVCTMGTQSCRSGVWGECSGTNPSIEVCDGLDNDCNGEIDESCGCVSGDTRPCGSDQGTCSVGIQTCSGGEWGHCEGSIEPSTELCDNLDNDCDGMIDEDLIQECGDFFIGECAKGTQTCSGGEWSVCEGEVLPTSEICDNLDNDCDGNVDESVTKSCGNGGEQSCMNGIWEECIGSLESISPILECIQVTDDGVTAHFGYNNKNDFAVEIPVGSDNKFNPVPEDRGQPAVFEAGRTSYYPDSAFTIEFESGNQVWTLAAGGQTKTATVSPNSEVCEVQCGDADGDGFEDVACGGTDCDDTNDAIYPNAVEMCDGIDNNCNEVIDESLTRSCGSDVGACTLGTETCSNGVWGSCMGGVQPIEEVCDNVDNDCDGSVDELLTRSCGSDIGLCISGTETCGAGEWGACEGSTNPVVESCDGLDNDCDGITDEDCECIIGETQSCGSDVGACSFGVQTCTSAGWSSCNATQPSLEICDGIDNDCNGIVDENLTQSCGDTDVGVCSFGSQICSNGTWGACAGAVNSTNEVCDDNLDNNCDGFIDESCEESSSSSGGSGGSGGGGGGSSGNKDSEDDTSVSESVVDDFMDLLERTSTHKVDSTDEIIKALRIDERLPNSVDLVDQFFTLDFEVENIGTVGLSDVTLQLSLPNGWIAENEVVDLSPSEKKKVSFLVFNNFLDSVETETTFREKELDVEITAFSKEVTVSEKYDVPFVVDDFDYIFPIKDFSTSYDLKTCYFINNFDRSERDKLEIEFQLFDQKTDVFVDFLSPIEAKEDSVKIICETYDIEKSYIQSKVYNSNAFLFESGTLFTGNYIKGKSRKTIDLQELQEVEPTIFEKWIRGIIG